MRCDDYITRWWLSPDCDYHMRCNDCNSRWDDFGTRDLEHVVRWLVMIGNDWNRCGALLPTCAAKNSLWFGVMRGCNGSSIKWIVDHRNRIQSSFQSSYWSSSYPSVIISIDCVDPSCYSSSLECPSCDRVLPLQLDSGNKRLITGNPSNKFLER